MHIGPISLRPHFNDVATTPPPMPEHDDLRDGYGSALTDAADARQSAPELAAWTVASAAALAVPGVATLAYFEEWGPRGVRAADGSGASRCSTPSRRSPRCRVQAGLRGDSPDGLVWALGARTTSGDSVLVANLDAAHGRSRSTFPAARRASADVPPGAFVRL